jgi:hypothetical protein
MGLDGYFTIPRVLVKFWVNKHFENLHRGCCNMVMPLLAEGSAFHKYMETSVGRTYLFKGKFSSDVSGRSTKFNVIPVD